MVGTRITVNEVELREVLTRMGRIGRDPREFLEDVGQHLLSETQDRLLAGGPAPDGAAWPDWNPLYRKFRPKLSPKGGMMNLRGRLRDSITTQVQGRQLRVGTNTIYARVHQFGAVIEPVRAPMLRVPGVGMLPSVTIPARPFLGVSAEDRREIVALFNDHARRAMARFRA